MGALKTATLVLTGLSSVAAVLVTLRLVRRHVRSLTRPREQGKIVGILYLVPVFAVDAWVSLVAKGGGAAAPVLSMVREVYEGYVVYLLFKLFEEFMGGETRLLDSLEARQEPTFRLWPLNVCWGALAFAPGDREGAFRWFRQCKVGTMQYVVLRPVLAVLVAVLNAAGVHHRGSLRPDDANVWISLVVNVSTTWAVYSLLAFFFALRPALEEHDPVPKLISVKAIVFVTFWQSIFIEVLAAVGIVQSIGSWTVDDVETGLNNVFLCFEMLLAALYNNWAFPVSAYDVGNPSFSALSLAPHDVVGLQTHAMELGEVSRDFSHTLVSVGSSSGSVFASGSSSGGGGGGGGGGAAKDGGATTRVTSRDGASFAGDVPLLRGGE